jgi:hypothetical protein
MSLRFRRPFAVLAALLCLVAAGSLVFPQSGSAQTGDAPTGATPAETFTIIDQSSWVGPTGTFTVSFAAPGAAPDTTFSLNVHNPVSTRDQFLQTARGNQLGGVLFSTPQRSRSELDPGSTGRLTVTIPLGDRYPTPTDGLVLFEKGVYPVAIRATGPGGENRGRLVTHLVRLGTSTSSAPTLAVGAVVRLEAPVAAALDGSPYLDDLAAETAARRIAVVGRYPTVRFTILPSAQTLRLLTSRTNANDPLAPLRVPAPGHQLLGSTYAPIPAGSWVASGLDSSFGIQLAGGAATIGTLLGTAPDGRIAYVDPSVTPDALGVLRGNGVESVLVPSDRLDPLTDRSDEATLTQRFDVRTATGDLLDAVASDSRIAELLTPTDDPVLAGHLALAQLAMVHLQQQGAARGIAVVVPDNADPVALDTFLAGLADSSGATSGVPGAPMISPVSANDLFLATDAALGTTNGQRATLVRTFESDQTFSLGEYPDQLLAAGESLNGIRSLVPDSPELVDPISATVLSSGSATLDPEAQSAMLAHAANQASLITSQIVVPAEQVVTLTSSSGLIPLTIENRLSVRARVRIVFNSPKLDFPDGPVVEQVLEPATTTRIDVAVTTKASGAFPLDVAIRSADNAITVASTRFTVRSTSVSGFGLFISIGAGLFLLLWWIRHFRTSRRAEKLMPATAEFAENPPSG